MYCIFYNTTTGVIESIGAHEEIFDTTKVSSNFGIIFVGRHDPDVISKDTNQIKNDFIVNTTTKKLEAV